MNRVRLLSRALPLVDGGRQKCCDQLNRWVYRNLTYFFIINTYYNLICLQICFKKILYINFFFFYKMYPLYLLEIIYYSSFIVHVHAALLFILRVGEILIFVSYLISKRRFLFNRSKVTGSRTVYQIYLLLITSNMRIHGFDYVNISR